MTEPDIADAVKKILGARVVYVFSFLHLARWISVRNSSEIKGEKKRLFDQLDPCATCLLKFMLQKIQLGADISSVTFPEFFTWVKENPRWIYLRKFLINLP